jgi:hypothetical protein
MMSLLIPVSELGVNRRTGVGSLPRRFNTDQTLDGLMLG